MDRTPLEIWLTLVRVMHHIGRRSSAHLNGYNLTPAQFDVLAQLGSSEGMTQQMLADRLLVTRGNVSGLLDRMESQGLLKRHPHPDDARSYLVALTAEGRALLDQAMPEHQALIAGCFASLSGEEQARLGATLHYLEHTLR